MMPGISSFQLICLLLRLVITLSTSAANEDYMDTDMERNVRVPLGSETVLTCTVSDELSAFPLEVSWTRADDHTVLSLNSRIVTRNHRLSVSRDDFTYHLYIKQVKESDRGCYFCQINSSVLTDQIICIDVLVSPDIEETSKDVTLDEGQNATLTCKARGHPHPMIYWRREDNQLINQHKMVNSSVLTLTHIRREDSGAYLCIASNNVPPTVSKRIFLTINFRPEVHIEDSRVGCEEGKDVRLVGNCFASPKPQVVWIFNNLVISYSHKHSLDREESGSLVSSGLRLRSVGPGDFGYYTFVCNNTMGRRVASLELYRIEDLATTAATIYSANKPIWKHGSLSDDDVAVTEIDDNSLGSMTSAKASSVQVTVLESIVDHNDHVSSSTRILASFIYILIIIISLF